MFYEKENDGTGGGQKNGKLILYYGEKYYLRKVVNGQNYGRAAFGVMVSIFHLTAVDERLCKVAYSVFFACADWMLSYFSRMFCQAYGNTFF